MTNDKADRRAMSAAAARRLYAYVKETDLSMQVSLDIGIVLGRLGYLEGKDWMEWVESDWHEQDDH